MIKFMYPVGNYQSGNLVYDLDVLTASCSLLRQLKLYMSHDQCHDMWGTLWLQLFDHAVWCWYILYIQLFSLHTYTCCLECSHASFICSLWFSRFLVR